MRRPSPAGASARRAPRPARGDGRAPARAAPRCPPARGPGAAALAPAGPGPGPAPHRAFPEPRVWRLWSSSLAARIASATAGADERRQIRERRADSGRPGASGPPRRASRSRSFGATAGAPSGPRGHRHPEQAPVEHARELARRHARTGARVLGLGRHDVEQDLETPGGQRRGAGWRGSRCDRRARRAGSRTAPRRWGGRWRRSRSPPAPPPCRARTCRARCAPRRAAARAAPRPSARARSGRRTGRRRPARRCRRRCPPCARAR